MGLNTELLCSTSGWGNLDSPHPQQQNTHTHTHNHLLQPIIETDIFQYKILMPLGSKTCKQIMEAWKNWLRGKLLNVP